jgi:hypothetical protein
MARLPLVLVLLLAPAAAFAQGTTPPTQGRLVIEHLESGFAVAPDYKITELDDEIAHLAGGYAGWITEDTLFVGGAAYSVANRSDDFKMTYGGLLVGWAMPPERRIQFGARGLVGIGRATLGTDIELLDAAGRLGSVTDGRFGDRAGRLGDVARFGARLRNRATRLRIDDDVFVFEPQLTLVTKLTNHIAVNVGAGYRVTAFADRLGDRVNGLSGSLGVQLGGW